jgi:hypothetical protein
MVKEKLTIAKIRTKMKMTGIDFSDFLTQMEICLLNKNEEQKRLERRKEFCKDFSTTNKVNE